MLAAMPDETSAGPAPGSPGHDAPLLLTGANGHLGRRLIERLAGRRPVRAIVRSERAADVLRSLPDAVRPEIVIVDYADEAGVADAARGCRDAVHLVGVIKEAANTRFVDAHEGTCRVLAEAARAAGLERIVYLSILGSRPDSDNACLASKGRAEQILLEAATPAAVLRVPMVLGPDDVASRALGGMASAKLLPMIRGGRTLQQPIDAADVVEAVIACLGLPERDDVALDLGGPECLAHRELVARAAACLDRPAPTVVPIPHGAVWLFAALMERVSASPPLSRAMLGVLEHDDRVDPEPACKRLGLALTPLDETLKRCLPTGAGG